MKQLYKVNVEYTTYVMAENEREAEREAVSYDVKDDLYEGNTDFINAQLVTSLERVPQNWQTSIPWNGDDKTIKEILK